MLNILGYWLKLNRETQKIEQKKRGKKKEAKSQKKRNFFIKS